MSFLTVDFETYYGDSLGFKTQTNEEYLRDPRFEVIGVSVKEDNAPAMWCSGTHEEIKSFLLQFDWQTSAMLAHNALFDGAILAWHFGITPAFYYDTLCMARAVHGVDAGGSLAALADYYAIGKKGTEVVNAYGKRREDFTASDLHAYGEYCKNDVELTYKLYNILDQPGPLTDDPKLIVQQYKYLKHCNRPTAFSEDEYRLIDMTLRMYIHPALHVDDALLVQRLDEIRAEKTVLLDGLKHLLQVGDTDEVRKKLASNKQFAGLLRDMGLNVPLKISPTTGKETYALAKNDEGFIALLEHEDPVVQQLCSVRLGTKSTMEESRIEQFINIGSRNKGLLPIPLKYYGAHTGRWSGQDSINLQNLPSRDKKKKTLKNSLVAPPGKIVINCDSSQIEARVLAWLAGQTHLVEEFARGEDVYSTFASVIYGFKITKTNPVERFVGKTCLGLGSLVLSERGWIPIEQITVEDRVWDGEEWVCHSGVVSNGMKETLPMYGLWLTPDHQVWSGTWQRADSLLRDEDTLCRALGIAAVNLPSQAMWLAQEVFGLSLYDAIADQKNTQLIPTILRILSQLAALCVRRKQQVQSVIGNMLKQCPTTLIEHGFSIGWPQPSPVAIQPTVAFTNIMGSGEYESATNGAMTEQRSYGMSRHCRDGITQTCRWTELITTAGTSRGIFDLLPASKTCTTGEKWLTLRPVFDILNCGSKNRFTVLTERGPLIVHNCILGLGYGTGSDKLKHTLKTQPPGADLPLGRCVDIVKLYRETNHMIPKLWRECEAALDVLTAWPEERGAFWLGKVEGAVQVAPEGLRLPNGMYIRYPKLRKEGRSYIYDSRRGVKNLWGGAVTENIVQALARIVVGEQMLKINEKYRVVLTVHDAAVTLVDEADREQAISYITQVMSTPPDWAVGLPVACEAKWGRSYGDC